MSFGKQMSRPTLWCLVYLGLFFSGPSSLSYACEPSPNTDQQKTTQRASLSLDTIMENLGQRSIREQPFHETYYSGMLITPSFKEGTLVFHPPDRLEKHVRSPTQESFIAKGNTLLYENPSRDISQTFSLQEYPALATLIEGLRALFSGNKASLQQFFNISMTGTPADWKLELSPLIQNEEDGVSCIRLTGEQAHLSTISIQEVNGDSSELQLDPQVP